MKDSNGAKYAAINDDDEADAGVSPASSNVQLPSLSNPSLPALTDRANMAASLPGAAPEIDVPPAAASPASASTFSGAIVQDQVLEVEDQVAQIEAAPESVGRSRSESLERLDTCSTPLYSNHEYREHFRRFLTEGSIDEVLHLVETTKHADWNFVFDDPSGKCEGVDGLSPLCSILAMPLGTIEKPKDLKLINLLLENGANPSYPEHTDERPARLNHLAFMAAYRNRRDIMKALHDHGYKLDTLSNDSLPDTDYWFSLAHAAAESGALEVIDMLIDHLVDCRKEDAFNRNPLHMVMYHSMSIDVAKSLLDHGVDAFAMDSEGYSPFGVSISIMPAFALLLLQTKSTNMGAIGQSVVWKHDFVGIMIDENGDPILMHNSDRIDAKIRREARAVRVSGRRGVMKPVRDDKKKKHKHAASGDANEDVGADHAHRTSRINRIASVAVSPEKQQQMKTKFQGVVHTNVSAINLMYASKRKELLLTPIIRYLLETKWDMYAKKVWRRRLIEYLLFFFSYSATSFMWPTVESLKEMGALPAYVYPPFIFALLSGIRLLHIEMQEFFRQGAKNWFSSIWNIGDLFMFMALIPMLIIKSIVAIGYPQIWWHRYVNGSATIHILFCSKLLQFSQTPRITGSLVTMVLGMLRDIVRFFAFFIPVYLSFTNAYYVLFREVIGRKFKYHNLMMMLLRWIFGDVDYGELSETLDRENRTTGQVFFIIFMTLVTIVLLNVVIAMMTNTFQAVIEDAEGEWLLEWAGEILGIDSTTDKKDLRKFRQHVANMNQRQVVTNNWEYESRTNWAAMVKERIENLASQQTVVLEALNALLKENEYLREAIEKSNAGGTSISATTTQTAPEQLNAIRDRIAEMKGR